MGGRGAACAGWAGLVSVLVVGLFGVSLYLKLIAFIISFVCGVLGVMYLHYDKNTVLPPELNHIINPLEQSNFSVQLPKVLDMFESDSPPAKLDQRITGSETVDSFLNEIVDIVVGDYVAPWYDAITADDELKTSAIKQTVRAAGANLANRVKSVDWVQLLATRFPEEITTHLKLFKQARARMKHLGVSAERDVGASPKRDDKRQAHRRNKSETDAGWFSGNLDKTQVFGKSKFYASSDNLNGKTLKDIFFELECLMEEKQICRDIFCMDPEKENALLCEVSEAILYLIAPEDAWRCTSMKLILVELLAGVVFTPLLNLVSDPDNINRLIIQMCCREGGLPSELFLTVVRCCEDAEELDATLELVNKEVQKLHSRDSGGECELPVRQQLSSLHYLTRVVNARRASLAPQEALFASATDSHNSMKVDADVQNSLQFLKASSAWRSNAQYALELEGDTGGGGAEAASEAATEAALERLRESALQLCESHLAPGQPPLLGLPADAYAALVLRIRDHHQFRANPVGCFDELQKCIFDALEDVPLWQTNQTADLFLDPAVPENIDSKEHLRAEASKPEKLDRRKYSARYKNIMKNCLNHIPKLFHRKKSESLNFPDKWSTFPRCKGKTLPSCKNHTLPKCTGPADSLPTPGLYSRHNRSRSDIVGSSQRIITDNGASTSNLSASANISLSHSDIDRSTRITAETHLKASIIETALVQDKGRTFGIYAIAVTRLSDNEIWHIYRRYSDFYDLHCSVKDRWPELAHLPFPGKKTFQNTSRTVLERRKAMLNAYLQSLSTLARQTRYADLLSDGLLGGFLSDQNQAERQTNSIDALLVNSLRAGMRTLKSVPDQLANTVDGVMDGISKVFQGKTGDPSYIDGMKFSMPSDSQDEASDSVALRLLEEALGLRGLWLRRHLLAPVRTLLADHINKKVLEYVSTLTSPRNIVQYLKYLKQWLTSRGNKELAARDAATRARARLAAKVALLAACSDELRHIVGTDTARRGLLTVFQLLQTQEIEECNWTYKQETEECMWSVSTDELRHIVGTDTARRGLLTVFQLLQTQEIEECNWTYKQETEECMWSVSTDELRHIVGTDTARRGLLTVFQLLQTQEIEECNWTYKQETEECMWSVSTDELRHIVGTDTARRGLLTVFQLLQTQEIEECNWTYKQETEECMWSVSTDELRHIVGTDTARRGLLTVFQLLQTQEIEECNWTYKQETEECMWSVSTDELRHIVGTDTARRGLLTVFQLLQTQEIEECNWTYKQETEECMRSVSTDELRHIVGTDTARRGLLTVFQLLQTQEIEECNWTYKQETEECMRSVSTDELRHIVGTDTARRGLLTVFQLLQTQEIEECNWTYKQETEECMWSVSTDELRHIVGTDTARRGLLTVFQLLQTQEIEECNWTYKQETEECMRSVSTDELRHIVGTDTARRGLLTVFQLLQTQEIEECNWTYKQETEECMWSVSTDELRHIVGTDTARRGLLTVFQLLQTQEIEECNWTYKQETEECMWSVSTDELRHIVGTDTARRGLLTVFQLLQTQEIEECNWTYKQETEECMWSVSTDELRHIVGTDTARRGLLTVFQLLQTQEIEECNWTYKQETEECMWSASTDELRHIVGTDTARRGLLTVFQLLQTQEIEECNWTYKQETEECMRSVSTDELRHIVGTDTARRGLLTVFQLLQTQEINKRLVLVLLEATASNLFPDNNTPELFRRLYGGSPRASPHVGKKQTAV